MHKLALKFIDENNFKHVEGQEKLYLQNLEVGMTMCTPVLRTDKCQKLVMLSKEYLEFKNGVRHVIANCTENQRITVAYDESKKRYISPKFIYHDEDGNLCLFPDYVGYFPKGQDELIVYWVNGDELVGDDPETLSRFIIVVEKEF